MLWLIPVIALTLALPILLVLLGRKNRRQWDRVSLANRILRQPERILIDLPLFLREQPSNERHVFLMDTERELARMGKFPERRQLVMEFAKYLKAPSLDSLKDLSAYMLTDTAEEFRELIRYNGICLSALRFFELVLYLTRDKINYTEIKSFYLDSYKNLEILGQKKGQKGSDGAVVGDWVRLFKYFRKLFGESLYSGGEARKYLPFFIGPVRQLYQDFEQKRKR